MIDEDDELFLMELDKHTYTFFNHFVNHHLSVSHVFLLLSKISELYLQEFTSLPQEYNIFLKDAFENYLNDLTEINKILSEPII